jgi:hypothetical protein
MWRFSRGALLIPAPRQGGWLLIEATDCAPNQRSSGELKDSHVDHQADIASSAGCVALHVKPDKMPELKRETFTA